MRTSKKIEKKEEEKLTEGNQQSLSTTNFFDSQGVQSPSVQMQMSPAQTSQPSQMNFNMPQTMNMPNPFGINHSTLITNAIYFKRHLMFNVFMCRTYEPNDKPYDTWYNDSNGNGSSFYDDDEQNAITIWAST